MPLDLDQLEKRAAKRRRQRRIILRASLAELRSERLLMVDYFDRLPIEQLRACYRDAKQQFE